MNGPFVMGHCHPLSIHHGVRTRHILKTRAIHIQTLIQQKELSRRVHHTHGAQAICLVRHIVSRANVGNLLLNVFGHVFHLEGHGADTAKHGIAKLVTARQGSIIHSHAFCNRRPNQQGILLNGTQDLSASTDQ